MRLEIIDMSNETDKVIEDIKWVEVENVLIELGDEQTVLMDSDKGPSLHFSKKGGVSFDDVDDLGPRGILNPTTKEKIQIIRFFYDGDILNLKKQKWEYGFPFL